MLDDLVAQNSAEVTVSISACLNPSSDEKMDEKNNLGDYMLVQGEEALGSILQLQVDRHGTPTGNSTLCFILKPADEDSNDDSEKMTLQTMPIEGLVQASAVVKKERVEPEVVFSSTPDLASKSPSDVSESESATEGLRTPVIDDFIIELDRKLLELVEKDKENEEIWSCHDPENITTTCTGFESYVSSRMGYSRSLTCTEMSTAHHSSRPSRPPSVSALKRKRSTGQEIYGNYTGNGISANGSTAQHHLDQDRTQGTPPASKRAKPIPDTSFSYIAKEAASIRRARSLTVDVSFEVPTEVIPTVSVSPRTDHESEYDDCSTTSSINSESKQNERRKLIPVLPIIAPPSFQDIPRAPASPDDAAEVRLRLLLEKERLARQQDGFESGINECFTGVSQEQIDQFLGIDEHLRRSVVDWMLAITPSKSLRLPHLREHLRGCPETKYHAILLFSRYFMRVGEEMPVAGKRETNLMKRGRQRIVWEVAMSCLALAVKFNRDFLRPLTPVHSRSFAAIAPYSMSHDDLEISQKDVLEVLSYQIWEVTPGPFLDEIWNSLPTLRKLVAFPEGWPTVQQNAWRRLNACAPEGEMLQFPISLITAAAMIDGIIEALMAYYDSEDMSKSGRDKALEAKATCAVAGIVDDVKDILGVKKKDLNRCRAWIRKQVDAE